MKRILLLPLVALLFSCGGTTSQYESLIADVVQTDGGVKIDLNFKAESLEEIRQISVADSIKIITEEFNADRDKKREQFQRSLARNQENLDKEKSKHHPGNTMMTFYQKNIDLYAHRIDSLDTITPILPARYENTDGSEILAVVIRCTYSIDEPLTEKRATETFDFVLSPDGTTFYSKKRVKE